MLTLIILVIALGIITAIVPMDARARQILWVLVAVVAAVVLLQYLGLAPHRLG